MINFNNFIVFFKNQIIQFKKNFSKLYLIYIFKKTLTLFISFALVFIYLPFFLFIRLISNFYLIRFGILPSRNIGHFSCDTNLYICNKKNSFNKTFDIFYLQKPVCNFALLKIFKRYLVIMPEVLIAPLIALNKIKFMGNQKHYITLNPWLEGQDLRININENKIEYFNEKEKNYGQAFLKNLGITSNEKYICFFSRDESYVELLFSKTYDKYFFEHGDQFKFKKSNIENFKLAINYLTDLGYYVIRMGQEIKKPSNIKSIKFIDYAGLGMRNEFLDIYLPANCEFFFGSGCGLDTIAKIHNKPRIRVCSPTIALIDTIFEKELTLLKHHYDFKNNKNLCLSEIFDLGLATATKDMFYEKKNIKLIDNSPIELKESVIEMLNLIKNNFQVDEERKYYENLYWSLFKKKLNQHGLENLHVDNFKAHIGLHFLKNNRNYLN